MIERDYIMRMFNQLVQVLARVLLHKKAYEYPQAKREIEAAYKSMLGVTGAFVRSFSDAQLVEMFGKDVETAGIKLYLLGSLLKEEADIHRMTQGEEDTDGTMKALSLLLSSFLDLSKPLEERHIELLDDCILRLKATDVPLHIMEKLFAFYEQWGRFNKAEDVLFDLVALEEEYKTQGLAFYERLLNKSSEELQAGGLPRTEVLDGIEHIKREERTG